MLVVSTMYMRPCLPPPAISVVPGMLSTPEEPRSWSPLFSATLLLGVNQSRRVRDGDNFTKLLPVWLTPFADGMNSPLPVDTRRFPLPSTVSPCPACQIPPFVPVVVSL